MATAPKQTDQLDKWERFSKIISLLGIPLVLAIFGWIVQDKLSEKNVSKDYVNIALTILTDEKKEINPALRNWAVDLLNDNSPTKFDKETLKQLKSGEISFPSLLKDLYGGNSSTGDLAISSDSKYFAVGAENGGIQIWDYATKQLKSKLAGHEGGATCMTFDPTSRKLYTGGMDNKVKIWDIESGNLLAEFMGSTAPIKGIAIAPDGRTFLISSFDNTITQWDVASLKLVSKLNIGN